MPTPPLPRPARRAPHPPGRAGTRARVRFCGALTLLLAWSVVTAAPAAAQAECAGAGPAVLPETEPWQLRRLDPAAVWPLTRGAGITVAVLDSGVSASHPMLAGKVAAGADFGLPDESGRCDLDGHGTAIAGLIAGRELPGVTIHGIAPDAAILPGRILPQLGQGLPGQELPDRIAEAVEWAVEQGADIINLSVESAPSPRLEQAVAAALDDGVVLVAAAGNLNTQTGEPSPGYPAGYDGVLAVAGVDEAGGHVETSQIAGYVDVAAPGTEIYGPAPGEGYRLVPGGGTSYAAGYVSGVAALVRAYHPDLAPAGVVERIMTTADPPPEGRTDQVGHGVVNPYRAVTTVLGARPNAPAAVPPPPDPVPDPYAQGRRIAPWLALGGAAVAGVLLALPALLRRGRQRGWRPAA